MVTAPAGEGGGNDQGQQGAEVGADAANGSGGGTDEGKTFTQADLDRVVEQRLARERAKFTDYDELKSAAAELQKIRDGEKTELQREREAREAAEKRAEKAEFSSLRSDVARAKGVPASSLTGASKEELEASADELIAWRDQQQESNNSRKKPSVRDLKSGTTGGDTASKDPKAAAAEALRRLRVGGG